MWLPGALCGALWEISNIGSLVSVQFLGEGVGFSVVQAALLVSGTFWFITKDISLSAFFKVKLTIFFSRNYNILGLWGIFWFNEIRGRRTILLWLTSALITLAGVILLSHEHLHG
jgi:glucose uptake protein GlcU